MKFQEKVLIDTAYRPKPYSLGRPKRCGKDGRYYVSQWYRCREIWHLELKESPFFFFSHEKGYGERVASFIWQVEKRLGVPFSEMGPTNRHTVMWVEPSSWWIERSMRRSLFTIFMRAGKYYDPQQDNFKDALFGDEYICLTYYAVERFLSGHTRYVGRVSGWVTQFFEKQPSQEEVDYLLQLPKSKTS